MSGELKSIIFHVEKESVNGSERTWDLRLQTRDAAGSPLAGQGIHPDSQKLEPPKPITTGEDGEARCTISLAPQEPPPTVTHGPGLWLAVEAPGDTVTFTVRALDSDDQPQEGLEVVFVSNLGTLEPHGAGTTDAGGFARCTLEYT